MFFIFSFLLTVSSITESTAGKSDEDLYTALSRMYPSILDEEGKPWDPIEVESSSDDRCEEPQSPSAQRSRQPIDTPIPDVPLSAASPLHLQTHLTLPSLPPKQSAFSSPTSPRNHPSQPYPPKSPSQQRQDSLRKQASQKQSAFSSPTSPRNHPSQPYPPKSPSQQRRDSLRKQASQKVDYNLINSPTGLRLPDLRQKQPPVFFIESPGYRSPSAPPSSTPTRKSSLKPRLKSQRSQSIPSSLEFCGSKTSEDKVFSPETPIRDIKTPTAFPPLSSQAPRAALISESCGSLNPSLHFMYLETLQQPATASAQIPAAAPVAKSITAVRSQSDPKDKKIPHNLRQALSATPPAVKRSGSIPSILTPSTEQPRPTRKKNISFTMQSYARPSESTFFFIAEDPETFETPNRTRQKITRL